MLATSLIAGALAFLSLDPQYIIAGRPRAAAPAGCNEFTDDFSGTLSGWTDHAGYSLDDPNDEYDVDAVSGDAEFWARYDTDTTSSDHCACIDIVADTNGVEVGIGLRIPTTLAGDAYNVYEWGGGLYIERHSVATDLDGTWECWTTVAGSGVAWDTGDSVCACVNGTGASTDVDIYEWSGTARTGGDCQSGWGATATNTWLDNLPDSACRVDTANTRVGIMIYDDSNDPNPDATVDNFVGGDSEDN